MYLFMTDVICDKRVFVNLVVDHCLNIVFVDLIWYFRFRVRCKERIDDELMKYGTIVIIIGLKT